MSGTHSASHALQGRLKTTALCEASRDDVIASLTLFLSPRNQTPVGVLHISTALTCSISMTRPCSHDKVSVRLLSAQSTLVIAKE